jgi:hypothetical protein
MFLLTLYFLLQSLHDVGIRQNDPRLNECTSKIRQLQSGGDDDLFQAKDLLLDQETFNEYVMIT